MISVLCKTSKVKHLISIFRSIVAIPIRISKKIVIGNKMLDTCKIANTVIDGFVYTFDVHNDQNHKYLLITGEKVSFPPVKFTDAFPNLIQVFEPSLTEIRENQFKNLRSVRSIVMSKNLIKNIGNDDFKDGSTKKFTYNISRIDSNSFDSLSSL